MVDANSGPGVGGARLDDRSPPLIEPRVLLLGCFQGDSPTFSLVSGSVLPDTVFAAASAEETSEPQGASPPSDAEGAPDAARDERRARRRDGRSRTKSRRVGGAGVATRPASHLAVGSVIDKYRIEELLGTGAFAEVYRATHLLLRISVAIKLLKPAVLKSQPRLAALLCEEARFTAQLNHPNVVKVFDVTHTPQITYIVMELIEGSSLSASLEKKEAFSFSDVIRIGQHVCMGLKAAQAAGLIHRDIKPGNLLLSTDGVAKIVDLGLAQYASEGFVNERTGVANDYVVGTPAYMSPEQASSPELVDFRSDIYSLGATLYHAAVGVPPFVSRDSAELVRMHRTAPVPPPASRVPGFPPRLQRTLMKMLEKEPDARYRSYDELLKALRESLEEVEGAAPRSGAAPRGRLRDVVS